MIGHGLSLDQELRMKMIQYQRLFEAMVLQPVDELSDEQAEPSSMGKATPKSSGKAKASPKSSGKAKASPKSSGKEKSTEKAPTSKSKTQAPKSQGMKRPAAACETPEAPEAKPAKKKPAASEPGVAKKEKGLSVSKGYYKRDGVYEWKVNGSQVLKVP